MIKNYTILLCILALAMQNTNYAMYMKKNNKKASIATIPTQKSMQKKPKHKTCLSLSSIARELITLIRESCKESKQVRENIPLKYRYGWVR